MNMLSPRVHAKTGSRRVAGGAGLSAWNVRNCGIGGIADDGITHNLPTNIMDFRGFDSSIILILRGGIPRHIGNSPESLSQAILVGIMFVARLGVSHGTIGVSVSPRNRSGVAGVPKVTVSMIYSTIYIYICIHT